MFRSISLIFLLLPCASALRAQAASDAPASMPEVRVSADSAAFGGYEIFDQASVTRGNLALREVPQTVEVIDMEGRAIYGHGSLTDVLDGLGGVVAERNSYPGGRDTVRLRVGALPQYPANALNYNLTWSTDGVINEYIEPCEAVVEGKLSEVPALAEREEFSLDGVTYEAFNTSGGLGTLCETLAGRVRTLNYKTIRYPGHVAIMKALLNDLGLRHRVRAHAARQGQDQRIQTKLGTNKSKGHKGFSCERIFE